MGDGVMVKRDGGQITVTSGTGEVTKCSLDEEQKAWLVFELYGVTVKARVMSPGVEQRDVNGSEEAVWGGQTLPSRNTIADPVLLQEGIQSNFIVLLDSLNLPEFLDHLFEGEMITRVEVGRLHEMDRLTATRTLLLSILSVRPVSKKAFINALEKTLQGFLIEKFLATSVTD